MTLRNKMIEAIYDNTEFHKDCPDDVDAVSAADACAKIAEQEKIAFAIDVLNDILTESDNNGLPNWGKLAIKLQELKSKTNERNNHYPTRCNRH